MLTTVIILTIIWFILFLILNYKMWPLDRMTIEEKEIYTTTYPNTYHSIGNLILLIIIITIIISICLFFINSKFWNLAAIYFLLPILSKAIINVLWYFIRINSILKAIDEINSTFEMFKLALGNQYDANAIHPEMIYNLIMNKNIRKKYIFKLVGNIMIIAIIVPFIIYLIF